MDSHLIQANVDRYKEGDNSVIYYEVRVFCRLNEAYWKVDKRYSEFEALMKKLSIKYHDIPSLPVKGFWQKYSSTFLTKRQDGINDFLTKILLNKDIVQSGELREFLEVERHVPDWKINSPNQISEILLELKPAEIVANNNQLVIGASSQGLINTMNKHIRSIGLSEGSSTSSYALFLLSPEEEKTYNEMWRIPSALNIECICWNENLTILAYGTYEGFVYCYLVKTEIGCSQYEEFCEYHIHGGKIIGIAINYRNSYMYTCSEDKRLVVTQLNGQTDTKDITISNKRPVSMKCDFIKERVYIGTSKGSVHIFDISQFQPRGIIVVETDLPSDLSALCVKNHSLIIAGSTSGDVCVYQQGEGERETIHRLVIGFKAKSQINSIVYSKGRREIIVGTSEGVIIVWNSANGKLNYAWTAHDAAVSTMTWVEKTGILYSGSNDGYVKIWRLPNTWCNANLNVAQSDEMVFPKRKVKKKANEQMERELDDLSGLKR
ncbi:unnamed protein product [Blepharisma stoltei]|uniref:PX domain-containing protein n=1 Tax=Blepharisma stoltei TaxID=1481888 RepID=A0AAU9I9A2_9CILI|nr:unnamed protein product [Blepharisma stoltei]